MLDYQLKFGIRLIKDLFTAEIILEYYESSLTQVKNKSLGSQTIKYLEELHNLKTTRDRYLKTIGNLDAFEIDLKKETDDADGNYYQGCSLTIEDDKGKKFSTKNPLIIWTVAQEVTHICEGKLAEVEAKLVIK